MIDFRFMNYFHHLLPLTIIDKEHLKIIFGTARPLPRSGVRVGDRRPPLQAPSLRSAGVVSRHAACRRQGAVAWVRPRPTASAHLAPDY